MQSYREGNVASGVGHFQVPRGVSRQLPDNIKISPPRRPRTPRTAFKRLGQEIVHSLQTSRDPRQPPFLVVLEGQFKCLLHLS